MAFEQALREVMEPVVERAIKVAMTTTTSIVAKDYGVDADELNVLTASHHMMRSLTAGMAMITCQDAVNHSMTVRLIFGGFLGSFYCLLFQVYLRNAFLQGVPLNPSDQDYEKNV
jgi:hypothetical protein